LGDLNKIRRIGYAITGNIAATLMQIPGTGKIIVSEEERSGERLISQWANMVLINENVDLKELFNTRKLQIDSREAIEMYVALFCTRWSMSHNTRSETALRAQIPLFLRGLANKAESNSW